MDYQCKRRRIKTRASQQIAKKTIEGKEKELKEKTGTGQYEDIR